MSNEIKTFRNSRGLTQEQLGDEIGYAKSYISEIETGTKTPSFNFAQAIWEFSDGGLNLLKNQ